MKTSASPSRRRKTTRPALSSAAREGIRAARNHGWMYARLIIALRKHLGLSHMEVAARAGISPATVHSHERAGLRISFADSMRISRSLGIDYVTILHEVSRRLDEAGTPFFADKKAMSERAFLKMRCTPPIDDIPVTELRRQLRLMRQLTLPKHPARRPPKKRRPAARRAQ